LTLSVLMMDSLAHNKLSVVLYVTQPPFNLLVSNSMTVSIYELNSSKEAMKSILF
jgi:hypothetical protein